MIMYVRGYRALCTMLLHYASNVIIYSVFKRYFLCACIFERQNPHIMELEAYKKQVYVYTFIYG